MDRLTRRIDGEVWWYVDGDPYPMPDMDEADMLIAMNKLADYEDLESEGRLIKLPCSIGSTVWTITYQRDNFDDRHYLIITQKPFGLNDIKDIGNTVFLTEKEAEDRIQDIENRGL